MMIVPAQHQHVHHMLAAGLREADIKEVRASNGYSPKEALALSYLASPNHRWAAVENGTAFCMFGVAPYSLDLPRIGSPWLLATDGIARHQRDLLRYTRDYIPKLLAPYDRLVNHVDARHEESIRWLRWAGFIFDRIEPVFGHEQIPFLRFIMENTRV